MRKTTAAILTILGIAAFFYKPEARLLLEVLVTEPAEFQVYFNLDGDYVEHQSVKRVIWGHQGFLELNFPLPEQTPQRIRIDLGTQPGELDLAAIVLKLGFWERRWGPNDIARDFYPLNDISDMILKDDVLTFVRVGIDAYIEDSETFEKAYNTLRRKARNQTILLLWGLALLIYLSKALLAGCRTLLQKPTHWKPPPKKDLVLFGITACFLSWIGLYVAGVWTPTAEVVIIPEKNEDKCQLFYDSGSGFSENYSHRLRIVKEDEPYLRLQFPLRIRPFQPVRGIRLDTSHNPGSVRIQSIEIKSPFFKHRWDAWAIVDRFRPREQVTDFYVKHGWAYIESFGSDPGIIWYGAQDSLGFPVAVPTLLLFLVLATGLFLFMVRFHDATAFWEGKRYTQLAYRGTVVLLFLWFAGQMVYFAGMVPNEYSPDGIYHFTFVKAFSEIPGIFINDSPATYVLGPISTRAYLYHVILGKLLHLNFIGIMDLVFVRLFNIFISLMTLGFAYLVFKEISANRWFHIGGLVVLTNLLMFTFLAGMVSYDNLNNMLAAFSIYYFLRFLKTYRRFPLMMVLFAMLAGALTKITFAPLALLQLVVLAWRFPRIRANKGKLLRRTITKGEWLLGLSCLVLIILNIELYGGNLLRYQHLKPKCLQVLNYDICQNASSFKHQQSLLRTRHTRQPVANKFEYVTRWLLQMEYTTYEISTHSVVTMNPRDVTPYHVLLLWCILMLFFRFKTLGRHTVWPMVVLIAGNGFILFMVHYQLYLRYNFFGYAVSGRYLFPVLAPMVAIAIYPLFGWGRTWLKALILVGLSAVMFSGGVVLFLNNAKFAW